jgi:molybdopterin molybdotransferase
LIIIILLMVEDSSEQRISRLTPLADVLALVETRVGAVAPLKLDLAQALGCTLAEDVVARRLPPHAVALRDGYAVDAAALADAGPYMPVPLPSTARRIDAGDALPSDYDAVLPLDAVALRGGRIEAVAPVASGEGVLPAGDDATPDIPLRRAGERLRALDIAVLQAAGIETVTARAPRVSIVRNTPQRTRIVEAAREMLTRSVVEAGGSPFGQALILFASLDYEQPDLIICIGGTGSGRRDDAVRTLAQCGMVEAHGIAVSPGETAAVGFVGARPVLLVPGRLDAALAVWLLIGRPIVARLAGGRIEAMPIMMPLKRKVASSIGLAEVMPVRCADGMAEPLASGYLSFMSLTRSNGWIVVPAESEGFPAGTEVAVHPWP